MALLIAIAAIIGASGLSALLTYPQADDGTYCGAQPIIVLVRGARGFSEAVASQCRVQAGIQVAIGIALVGLAGVIALAPRWLRWINAREARYAAGERASGVWTHEPANRRVAWIFIGGFAAMLVVTFALQPGVSMAVFGLVLLVPFAWLAAGVFLHPRLELPPNEIVVVGAFSTRRVAVQDVVSVTPPGDFGCFLRLRQGGSVRIPMGSKNRGDAALGHQTHADDLVEAIAAHVAGGRHVPEEAILPTPEEQVAARKNARAALVIGLSWLALITVLMFLHR
jgi:hypothetical protein